MVKSSSFADQLTEGLKEKNTYNIGMYVTEEVNNFLIYSQKRMSVNEDLRDLDLMDKGLSTRKKQSYSKAGEAKTAVVMVVKQAKKSNCKTVEEISSRIEDALALLEHVESKMQVDSSSEVVKNLDKVVVKT